MTLSNVNNALFLLVSIVQCMFIWKTHLPNSIPIRFETTGLGLYVFKDGGPKKKKNNNNHNNNHSNNNNNNNKTSIMSVLARDSMIQKYSSNNDNLWYNAGLRENVQLSVNLQTSDVRRHCFSSHILCCLLPHIKSELLKMNSNWWVTEFYRFDKQVRRFGHHAHNFLWNLTGRRLNITTDLQFKIALRSAMSLNYACHVTTKQNRMIIDKHKQ